MKNMKGNVLLEKYRGGARLTRKEAILAKCADCCGMYEDGRKDCHVSACPLYIYAPYKDKKPTDG